MHIYQKSDITDTENAVVPSKIGWPQATGPLQIAHTALLTLILKYSTQNIETNQVFL